MGGGAIPQGKEQQKNITFEGKDHYFTLDTGTLEVPLKPPGRDACGQRGRGSAGEWSALGVNL